MIDWLIIGGGIHGVHLALVLLEAGVSRAALRIVDPEPRLLDRWSTLIANVGMSYLRSPVVHHVGVQNDALWAFAKTDRGAPHARFLPPYQQPSSELFQSQAMQLIAETRLEELHLPHRALRIVLSHGHARVELEQGSLDARRVVLAVGLMQPAWPSWAQALKTRGAAVHHVFDPGVRLAELPAPPRQVVIGGGLSAAQIALARAHPSRRVTLVSRHPVRVRQFDADPGWLGPKYMASFFGDDDVGRRRQMIDTARFRGSVPKETAKALEATDSRQLSVRTAEVVRVEPRDAAVRLDLSDGESIEANQVLLATGFDARRLGVRVRDQLGLPDTLPLSPCGFPLVDAALRWHPMLHVMGPLAELELGPTSRNIAGARSAAKRIMSVVRADASSMRTH